MKKAQVSLIKVLIILLFAACDQGDPAVDALHNAADSLMDSRPDSVLELLRFYDSEAVSWPRSQLMRHELLRAKAMNKAYIFFWSYEDYLLPLQP